MFFAISKVALQDCQFFPYLEESLKYFNDFWPWKNRTVLFGLHYVLFAAVSIHINHFQRGF